jgi:hypothetical protein
MKDGLGAARRQTLQNLRNEEDRKKKMTNTLTNFFGPNKLYLKSVAERGVIGPSHIKQQIEEQKKEYDIRKQVMDVNMLAFEKKGILSPSTINPSNSISAANLKQPKPEA